MPSPAALLEYRQQLVAYSPRSDRWHEPQLADTVAEDHRAPRLPLRRGHSGRGDRGARVCEECGRHLHDNFRPQYSRDTKPSLAIASLPAGALPLTISQIYGGGGNSGATYTHDFIEVFNAGADAVSLAGLSLQYASATGTGNLGANASQLTILPAVNLLPGQYFLLQEARGAGGSVPLPPPDVVDPTPTAMSAAGGKVALVNSTLGLGCNGGSTPCSPAQLALILDLVGYGNANFFETAPTPTLTNTTAAFRVNGGCTDTGSNAADFFVGAPTPRNSATPRNVCAVTPVPEPGTLGLLGIGLLGLGVLGRRTA